MLIISNVDIYHIYSVFYKFTEWATQMLKNMCKATKPESNARIQVANSGRKKASAKQVQWIWSCRKEKEDWWSGNRA